MTDLDHRTQRESGQVLPMTALLIVPLLVIAAFAIDIGSWYARASHLQRAADIAALAGAQVRGNGGTDLEVQDEVNEVLAANGIDPADIVVDVDLSSGRDVAVSLQDQEIDLYFAGLVIDDVTIGRDAAATPGGCLGDCNQPIVITPPIVDMPSQSEGDGFKPYITADVSKVFTLNHHVDSADQAAAGGWGDIDQLICVDISTRAPCPGYPLKVDTVTADRTKMVMDEARNHLWYPVQRYAYDDATLATGTTEVGMACIQIDMPTPCGEVIFRTFPQVHPQPRTRDFRMWTTQPVRVGTRAFMVTAGPTVHCLDLTTSSPCGGYPRSSAAWASIAGDERVGPLPTNPWTFEPESIVVQGRIYLLWPQHDAAGTENLLCWDPATNAACAGFGVHDVGASWSAQLILFEDVDAAGIPSGVCSYRTLQCRSLNGATGYNRNDIDGLLPAQRDLTDPFRWGNRTYFGNLWTDRAICVDLVAATSCGTLGGNGHLPYAFSRIPGSDCLMGLGDAGTFFTFARNMGPCPSGDGSIRLVPCSCDDGTFYWGLALFDLDFLSNFTSFTVTARNPAGTVVAGPENLLTNGGRIDLSSVNPSVPYIELGFSSTVASPGDWINPIIGNVTVTERPALRD